MTKPFSERAKTFADNWMDISLKALRQYSVVAGRVADDIDKEDFGAKGLVRTLTQLFDIAAFTGVELAETIVAGPAAPRTAKSEKVEPPDVKCTVTLTVDQVALPGIPKPIPRRQVSFDPPGTRNAESKPVLSLPPGGSFQVVIDTAGLRGGTYIATVSVQPESGEAHEDIFVPIVW